MKISRINGNGCLKRSWFDFFLDFIENWMFFFLNHRVKYLNWDTPLVGSIVWWNLNIFPCVIERYLYLWIYNRNIENLLWKAILLFDAIHDRYSYRYKLMTGVYNVSYNKYPISKNNDLVTVFIIIYPWRYSFTMYYVVSDNF